MAQRLPSGKPCMPGMAPCAQATARRVWVSNIPSAGTGNALSCAEMAVYLVLACLRSQRAMAESLAQRCLGVPLGRTLFGKTVLIVGFGSIARELVPRCMPLYATCLACVRGTCCQPIEPCAQPIMPYHAHAESLGRLPGSGSSFRGCKA